MTNHRVNDSQFRTVQNYGVTVYHMDDVLQYVAEHIEGAMPETTPLLLTGISNVLTAIKMAKYYEMGEHDVLFTIATDLMDLYHSRIHEMRQELGEYSPRLAAADFARWVLQQSTDNMLELRHPDRRRVHNLKFTPGSNSRARPTMGSRRCGMNPIMWTSVQKQATSIDALIDEFNGEVDLK